MGHFLKPSSLFSAHWEPVEAQLFPARAEAKFDTERSASLCNESALLMLRLAQLPAS